MFLNGLYLGAALGFVLMLVWHLLSINAKKRRFQQAMDNASLTQVSKAKALEKLLGVIPSWIQFPEFEEVGWFNKQLVEVWPYLNKAVHATLVEEWEPLLDEYKPTMVSHMWFKKTSLGSRAPEVEGVNVHQIDESQIIMDLDVIWQGQVKFIIGMRTTTKIPLQAQIKNLSLKAKLRLILQVEDTLPCIAAAVVAIYRRASEPHYDLTYELKGAGCNLDAVPGLPKMIHKSIKAALEDSLLWPNRMVYPLLPGYDTRHLEFQYRGAVVVTVVKGEKLKNKDIFDKSDPRALVWIRPTHRAVTRVIDNNLNPVWNETFELPVDDPCSATLYIEVQDKDAMGYDPLGYTSIPMEDVMNAPDGKEFHQPLCATQSLEECIGAPKLGFVTFWAIYRNYSQEERLEVTEAERKRWHTKMDRCLPPKEAEDAKYRALESARATAANIGRFRGAGFAADWLSQLQAASAERRAREGRDGEREGRSGGAPLDTPESLGAPGGVGVGAPGVPPPEAGVGTPGMPPPDQGAPRAGVGAVVPPPGDAQNGPKQGFACSSTPGAPAPGPPTPGAPTAGAPAADFPAGGGKPGGCVPGPIPEGAGEVSPVQGTAQGSGAEHAVVPGIPLPDQGGPRAEHVGACAGDVVGGSASHGVEGGRAPVQGGGRDAAAAAPAPAAASLSGSTGRTEKSSGEQASVAPPDAAAATAGGSGVPEGHSPQLHVGGGAAASGTRPVSHEGDGKRRLVLDNEGFGRGEEEGGDVRWVNNRRTDMRGEEGGGVEIRRTLSEQGPSSRHERHERHERHSGHGKHTLGTPFRLLKGVGHSVTHGLKSAYHGISLGL